MKILKILILKFKAMPMCGRCYFLASAFAGVTVAAALLRPSTSWLVLLPGGVSAFLLAAGFVAWFVPLLHSGVLTKPFLLLSLALTPWLHTVSVAMARWYVSASLGLPAQYFELTVSLLAAPMLLLMWLGCFIVLVLSALAFYPVVSWAQGVFSSPGVSRERANVAVSSESVAPSPWDNHLLGALVALVLVSGAVAYAITCLADTKLIRLAAYGMDFQQAENYPGARLGQRLRLLGDGNVAYANRIGGLAPSRRTGCLT
ncbi:hypothetical protein IMZ29_22320 [Achromobacter sp. GG226]|uniref:hypothetical protein n=1 Tax=Verticiella alkaliphila TaxID=2779529 RepID=UPI001C0E1E77|nr:hypothetical protein [Verticiella sp. GG226]MBU4613168.1 hypothetical protein [Verticiella sp. GG226]